MAAAKKAADEKEAADKKAADKAATDLRTATGVAFFKHVEGKISQALQPGSPEDVKEFVPYVAVPYVEDPKMDARSNATAQKIWDFNQRKLARAHQNKESLVVASRLAAEAKVAARAKEQTEFVADTFFGAGENLAELNAQLAKSLSDKCARIRTQKVNSAQRCHQG